MPERDLDLLIRVARAAGELARSYCASSVAHWDKPGDAGPVTEADLAVNDLMHRELQAARPDYGWLSEETQDNAARLAAERVFIVDPIDGTRSFIEGEDYWAHSLAVAERGEIVAAVVYLPVPDRLFAAARGEGASLNGVRIGVSPRTELTGAGVLIARPGLDPKHWRGAVPEMRRSYRPSLAYRMCLVAQGRYDAMITLRQTWEWDIAAGSLIVAEAGGVVSNRHGQMLGFNRAPPALDGVLVAPAPVHAEIVDGLVSGEK